VLLRGIGSIPVLSNPILSLSLLIVGSTAVISLALVPALGVAAALVVLPAMISLFLIGVSGRETRGRELRELESGP
jgi:hypothetical protein